MKKTWESELGVKSPKLPEKKKIIIIFFQATVESVLPCSTESWILTKMVNDRLDGKYTSVLRIIT